MDNNRILRYISKTEEKNDNNKYLKFNVIDLDFNKSTNNDLFNDEWIVWYHHLKNNWKLDGYRRIFKLYNNFIN